MITFTHTRITICRRYRQFRLIVWLCMCFFWMASASVASAQKTPCTYQKSLGKSGKQMKNPIGGYSMQAAHEDWNVIYCDSGTIALHRNNEAFFTYARWYNYRTDSVMTGLTCSDANYSASNGSLIWSSTKRDENKADATYYYNGTDTVYIACDQSSYLDGGLNGTVFKEPTIEQRMIFEIRPASKMADSVNLCTDKKWLETYDIIAPTGQTIHLGPKYAFMVGKKGEFPYPSYYYWKGTTTANMGSSSFSTGGSTIIGKWEQQKATKDDTVYVCTKAYTGSATNYDTITNAWDLKENHFNVAYWRYPVTDSYTNTDPNDANNILTWNYTRTSKSNNWYIMPASPRSTNEGAVMFFGYDLFNFNNNNKKYAEDVVFSTNLPNANNVQVTVKCRSSNAPTHILAVKYDNNSATFSNNNSNTNSIDKNNITSYSTNASTSSVQTVEVSFTAQSEEVLLYVDQIIVTYTIPGQVAVDYSVGDTIDKKPDAQYLGNWKKVVKTVSHNKWEKIDEESAEGEGWMWLKDGVNQATQAKPTVSSGQYIKETAPASPSRHTYQLLYSTGSSKTSTVYTNDTTITIESIYTYDTIANAWGVPSDSTNIEIINDTAVNTYGTDAGEIYHIAQFRVQYLDKNVVGPRAAEMSSFINNMELIAEQDFNYGYSSQNPLPSGVTQRFIPLPVEESTYGFYYGTDARLTETDNLKNCFYNEYSFVSNGFGYTTNSAMANHVGQGLDTNSQTGFALYTDGSQKAGTVFTLDFGADFCPGAKMFFTAWIGDQNKDSKNGFPIFTFYVEGIDAQGEAHTLTTFTTGEFKKEQNSWHHIIFPLEFRDDISYQRFKLRIVNMAATTKNNDFFIDDIRVYLQRASISPIQASTPKNVCLNEENQMVLYTRIDYGEIPGSLNANSTSREFYYRWFDMDGNPVDSCNYLNPFTQDDFGAGYVKAPARSDWVDTTNYPVATSFDAFDSVYHNTDQPKYAFIKEACINPDYSTSNRYVVYIATPVPVLFGQNYRCVVTYSANSLPTKADTIKLDNKCSSDAIVKTVNGLCIHSTQLGGFMADDSQASANISYRLTMVSEGMVRNGALSSKVVTYYYAHWLYGRAPSENDSDSIKNAKLTYLQNLYGAPYEEVKEAVKAYIQHVTLRKATASCTPEQENLVDRLVQARLLKLSDIRTMSDTSYIVYPLLTVDSINYTAFPIQSIYGEESACKEPKAITLFFPKKEESGSGATPTERNAIYFVGAPNETTPPDFVLSQPRRFRIPAGTKKQTVHIALTNASSTYTLQSAVLFETTNDSIDIKLANRFNWISEAGQLVTSDTATHTVTFNDMDSLPEGYAYTFRMDYTVQDQVNEGVAESYEGEAFITFIVVPDTLYYAGATGDAWNADAKWQRRNEKGKMVTAVAPLASTKVIYPKGNHVVLRPSSDKQQLTQLESNAQAFISYDINYAPYSCSEVYLPANTALVGQQYLKKSDMEVPRWTIELPVLPNMWKMNAIPLQAVVLGDIFVPAAGEKDNNPFAVSDISQTVGDLAIDRTTYSFYNSLYNSDVRQYNENGGYANISSSTWSFATNELDKPVPAGYGWALGYAGTNTNTTIRLPKPNTKYNYFKDGVWVTFSSSDIDRKNAGKPMFTPDSKGEMTITLRNNSASEIFLFGNPTFAYIDLEKLKDAYAYNDAVATDSIKIAGFYTTGVDKDSRYQLAAKTGGAEGWVSSVKQSTKDAGLLAPTEAVFIRFENAKNPSVVPSLKKVTLTLSTSMLCDKEGKYYGDGTIKPSSANAPAAQPEQALYITASRTGFMSSAVIVEDTTVEAEIFMLDKAKTPFAIFTVGNNRALAINHPRGEEHIPLALYAAAEVEQPTITFDGDPSYVMKWDLIDVKTGLREPLLAGRTMTLDLPLNGEVRYYLERTQRESEILGDTTEAFRLFAYCGQLIIYSEEPLYDLRVYDPTGRLIAASADAGNSFAIVLPAGTYIVRASGSTAKVIVH